MNSLFATLDNIKDTKRGIFLNQLIPIVTCLVLFVLFVIATYVFMVYGINPNTAQHIQIYLHPTDIAVGFFLYFVTAIDYALIVGRMATANPGAKARFVMNVFTCVGCFVGVSFVLFLWGFAKDVVWLILPLLVFAGSVMVKLAYEGKDYFEKAQGIPQIIRTVTVFILDVLFYLTRFFTFWIPELGSPNVKKMTLLDLAKWSFFLPFIIGLDDLIGYMGAMTVWNAFGLIFGIYLADILIDIMIFVSPKFTRKVVESAVLSLVAAYAFLYLAYKSFSETAVLLHEKFEVSNANLIIGLLAFILIVFLADYLMKLRGAKVDVHVKRE